MILNKQEAADILSAITYRCMGMNLLDDEEIRTLMILRTFFKYYPRLLTYDEFNELFDYQVKAINIDTYEIEVKPKKQIYVHVDQELGSKRVKNDYIGCSFNLDNKEHVQRLIYECFLKQIEELKTK